jgi:mRNA-degrading endonuclease YafQ of YafQ-DinJ toxin-antitoxin module
VVSNKKEDKSMIKLGKTKDGAGRESGYMTHNQSGEMFYVRKCYNCNLAEKVLIHILDKYRIQNNREWFEISKELAIYTIDVVCDFLDNFISFSEELQNSELLENLNKSLEIVKTLSKDDGVKPEKHDTKDESKEKEIKAKPIKKDVYDFTKFFKDRCEVGPNYQCSTYDIYGAYRLWSKVVRIEYKNEFTKYLNNHYKKQRKYFKEIKTSMTMYIGFRVKPFIMRQEDHGYLPKYEEFVLTNCEFGYNYKISVDDLMYASKNWFSNYPDYVFNIGEEKRYTSLCKN